MAADSQSSDLSNRIRTRACGIVIAEDRSHVLLVKVSVPTRKDPIWMPPGGAVQVGESLPEAVRREVREETGQLVDVHQLLSIHEFIQPPFHALEYYFKATISNQPQAEALKMDSKDHRVQEIRWVSQKDFTNYPIEPSYLHTLITKLLAAKLPEDPYPLFHQTRISDLPE